MLLVAVILPNMTHGQQNTTAMELEMSEVRRVSGSMKGGGLLQSDLHHLGVEHGESLLLHQAVVTL